jgi:hypothetical protein
MTTSRFEFALILTFARFFQIQQFLSFSMRSRANGKSTHRSPDLAAEAIYEISIVSLSISRSSCHFAAPKDVNR